MTSTRFRQGADASPSTPASTADRATETARWNAVLAKDRDADGEFVFAVRTTGVYCRPSCPARPARRANVAFFATTLEARSAGYRACLRCKPDDPSLEHTRHALVIDACKSLETEDPAPSLDLLAERAGLSPGHFHRVFRAVTGVTPKGYERAARKARVERALRERTTVTEALYEAGFNSSGRFYEAATRWLGMSARAFRAGGFGESIRYAVEPCALGFVLVAATERGVCAIEFADSSDALVDRLTTRFSAATVTAADPEFRGWVARVLAYVEHPRGLLDLPLDVRGTAFQQSVWNALRDIPTGTTATYTEVAQRIGAPAAVRAVAQACAGNAVAVAIPCHRVVRADGSLSGYRWGVERKAELLRREAAATDPATPHEASRRDSTP